MAQVELNVSAPGFALDDHGGTEIKLADFKAKKHVLLVLNRGFA